ncbi:MAG: glycosyltransferase, partial [Verrucomicrobia bacterium]|nr:glycosyltransferase [Verrucomicrobiota bacterium]
VSSPLADLAKQTLPSREFGVIPNGVDTRVFHPATEGDARDDSTIRLITVAQLIERKGIQHLIEAIAGMPAGTRARLQADVYGSGPYESVLREQIDKAGLQGTMTLKGLADEEVLAPELRAADIFVLPTQQEGLPLALMEAMASGLPCLTTPVGDIPQVLQGELAEMLVPPAQPEALRAALEALIDAPERRRALGAACRVAAEAYDWASIWSRYAAHVSAIREN